ncbi:MAG: alkaline phosphatase [Alphaproteobacteria bacterium]|nr:alkaline phosphatase [Alphaproteobacteria bacterium]MCB9794255.1 alkaline phosphatase [Alphaproteobacteria bacterium]
MRALVLLLAACSGGSVTVDKSSPIDSVAELDSEPAPCEQRAALSLAEASAEAFYWGGSEAPTWEVAATLETPPCEGLLVESDAAWLAAALEGEVLRLTLLPEALSSGRHAARVDVRDLDHAEQIATFTLQLSALVRPADGGRPKALVIGVDGLDGQELGAAELPNLARLAEGGTWTHDARTQLTGDTNSGPGWTSLLTGVEVEDHGVTYNGGYEGRDTRYPSFLARAREELGLSTAAAIQWTPIYEILEADAADQAWSGDWDAVTAQMVGGLRSSLYDLHFIHLDDVDAAGHSGGFTASSSSYTAAVERADAAVGALLEAILDRPTLAEEDWLILVSADHGGTAGGSHGCRGEDCQVIPLWVAGPSIPRLALSGGEGSHLDVHPTVLEHLGLDPSAYPLDGVSRAGLRERDCEDGLDEDEDEDGLTDCEDPDCAAAEACWECAPEPLSGVGSALATGLSPSEDHLAGSCGGEGGAELLYRWTAPESRWYAFDTMDCYRDTVLYLLDGGCGGEELACNESPSSTARSVVAAELSAGQEVVIVVDSDAGASGETCLAAYPFSDTCPDEALSLGAGSTSRAFTHRDVVYAGSCPPAVGVVWQSWTPPVADTWTISTAGSDFDTVLYVLDGCGGVEMACNDDSSGLQSQVSLSLLDGQELMVGVGSFAGRASSGTLVVSASH